ncbi:hypothetical protein CIB84_000811, partial [Bambusicola thoracicus]
MGGKNKQRTKGNVRPSSSGRAAELLAKERGTVPGFIGFGTSQSDLGYVPAVQGAEEIDSLVDADFRMVLRKLSKRDIITKLKAMQEFGTMCKEREAEVVKGVLPYWPRIYCKISLDHDRRVREATQQSFEQLILKVKKHLAPYLKSIMGYWLIAQCDTYSPAASAAKEAFEKAFPSSKQPEALAFCKDEILNVRSAFFEVASAFCQFLPELVKAEAPRVCPAVLLSIDDSDAAVCPALWEAVLHAIATIEDCWSHVNARKGVLPKLWTVLREGGRGLATVIYPNILPFISKVPPGITEPKLEYFRTFFSSIIQGLSNERALASPSESSAIITTFMECLRFAILQKTDEDEQRQIHQMLIYDQLIPLTDAMLQEPRLQNGPLFYQIAETLSSWEAKAEVSSDDNTNEVFQKLLSNFWDRLLKMCILHVDKLEADEKTLFAISDLLEVLQNPKTATKPNKRKSLKVKFSDEDESERNTENGLITEVRSNGDSEIQADLQHSSILRKEPLENLVCNLAELSIVYVNEQKSEQHLKFLSALLNSFSSNRVFQVLLEQGSNAGCPPAESQEDVKVHSENPSVQFLYMNLITWLKEDWRKDMHFLVDILYSVLNCCNSNDERKVILDDLMKACSSTTKLSLISEWLKGDMLGERLVMLADDLCHLGLKPIATSPESSSSEKWTVLSLVLSQHIKNVAELLYSLQWIEELENPPYLLLEYLHMLEEMHITYEKFSALSNTANLQQTIFDSNLKETSAQLLGFNIEMIRYLPLLLKYSTAPLADNEWDFIMCSMLAWLETTSENHSLYHVPLVQIFACVSCDLASALSAYFEPAAHKSTENLPVNLVSEWKEFFSEGIHNLLLPLFVKVTGETKTAAEGSFQNSVLTSLGEALTYISKDQLLNHKLPAKFVAGQKTNLPDNLQTLLNTLSPLLLFRARSVQVSVYHMLYKLMPELPKFDDEDLKSYGDEEEELALLMPENPVFSGLTSEVPNKDTKTFFTEELHLDVKGTGALSSQIPHLACSVYHITLKDLPAMVRLWWNSCEKRVFNVVDKFTSKYVSSVLSSQEISSVQTSTQLFNGMTVKARSATREVIATYSVDDIFIELIIQLPSNYPLGSITVESGKRVGVAVQQWRNWMLQLSTYLTHQ